MFFHGHVKYVHSYVYYGLLPDKEGQSLVQAKTERFEMRLDQAALEKVDAWRARQDDVPSRAEAVRRLMDAGLSRTSESQLKFSDGNKLTLLMLCEVYKHLKIRGEIDPGFVEAVIHGGHYWGLGWKYPGIFHGHEDNKRIVTEVVDVLDMWSSIESGYSRLSKKDRDRVEREADPFGMHVVFPGFDGNNESEYLGVARFLIKDLERFSSFDGRDLNSHATSIESYSRMLTVFEPMRRTLVGTHLNASQIIDVLKARTHPELRKS